MLKDFLTTLMFHDINHENILKSTIFVDDCERVHFRDFMKLANFWRLDQNVQDFFDVFKSIALCRSNFIFYKYLFEIFDSFEFARNHFFSFDVAFYEIMWNKNIHIYEKISKHISKLTYIVIDQLCDMLLLENSFEIVNYINKLRDLRKSWKLDVDFDHCTFRDFQKTFLTLIHERLSRI